MSEIYVSTDVESDGPIPGPHSMLSFASAAYQADKTLIATFSANLETLPGATPHLKTAEWWATQPQAWVACRTNRHQLLVEEHQGDIRPSSCGPYQSSATAIGKVADDTKQNGTQKIECDQPN